MKRWMSNDELLWQKLMAAIFGLIGVVLGLLVTANAEIEDSEFVVEMEGEGENGNAVPEQQ